MRNMRGNAEMMRRCGGNPEVRHYAEMRKESGNAEAMRRRCGDAECASVTGKYGGLLW